MLYSGFNILSRSVFRLALFNGRSDNTDVIRLQSEGNVTRFRFSIRTLLIVFAAIATFFPFRDAYETWRRDHLADSNYTYLDSENLCSISQGDSVETVTQLFSSLIEYEPTPTELKYMGFPKIDTTDQIYRYSFNDEYSGFLGEAGFGYFHFRDGRLASHPSANYADPAAMTLARGGEFPSTFDRMTAAPAYLVAIGLVSIIYLLSRKLIQMFWRLPTVFENSNMDKCANGG